MVFSVIQKSGKRFVLPAFLSVVSFTGCAPGFQSDHMESSIALLFSTALASSGFTVTPSAPSIPPGSSFTLKATGGIPPYSYSVTSGGGSVDSAGKFTAPLTAGSSQITVRDTMMNSQTVTVTYMTYSQMILATSGLAAYFRLGVDAQDSSGNAHHGTNVGAAFGNTSLIANDSEGSAMFNGAASINTISAPFNPSTTDFSLEMWIRPTTLLSSTAIGLVTQATGGAGTVWIGIDASATDQIATSFGAPPIIGQYQLQAGKTSHVIMTKVGSSLTFYVNGILRSVRIVTVPSSLSSLILGSAQGSAFFSGLLDEVAIYNRALSAQEAAQHYQMGMGQPFLLEPAPTTASVGVPLVLQPVGGVPPVTYSVLSGGGSVSSLPTSIGVYTPSGPKGTDVVQATDANGNTATASIAVDYSPYSFPNLQLLLDAKGITYQTGGSNVISWYDTSGWNRSTMSSPGNYGVYQPLSINGFPALNFPGASFYIINNFLFQGLFTGTNPITFVALFQTTLPGVTQVLANIGDAVAADYHHALVLEAGNYRVRRSPAFVQGGALVDTNPHVVVTVFDGTQVSIYLDGLLTAGPFPVASSINIGGAQTRIGAETSFGPSSFMGDIGQIAIYNRSFTAVEANQLSCGLARMYSLVLPACP